MITEAMKDCLIWLSDRGGDGVFIRTKAGGWYFLARGDTAEFDRSTWNQLTLQGYIEKAGATGKRRKLTESGKTAIAETRRQRYIRSRPDPDTLK